MPTNDFVPFATGGGANLATQAEHLAAASTSTGFVAGVAPSKYINKAIRQSSFISACLAKFVGDTLAVDVLDDGDQAGFLTKFVNALKTLLGNPAGTVIFGYFATAPTGYLKLNGAVPTVASVPNLVAASYCGDANNATAAHFYRCTDPLNPSTSRSTTGLYIKLPDWRASFPRALDDGRGIDGGRTLWTAEQADDFKSHTHLSNGTPGSGQGSAGADLVQQSASSQATSATGGTETRPRNMVVLACIKI
jgi:hypothetical protein